MRDRVIAAIGDLYDVGGEIGRGGMALVYQATDLRLRRQVAVKVLPPELAFRAEVRTRFLREAETAAQLNHPNIVPIYSVDERDGLVFFVMALVDGESLGQRLARDGAVPAHHARRILRDVADALAYAHARGVVHRDIKPDNILLERPHAGPPSLADGLAGRPMVTDFGIARAAEGDSRLTVTGVAVGTPAYMSPEQATGDRDLDGRSDLYSLGVVAYQMLSGQLPFIASNTPAMMLKHLSEQPRPLRELRRDLPAGLAATVERALAKRPDDRWADAAAFRDALAREHARDDPHGDPFAVALPGTVAALRPGALPGALPAAGRMPADHTRVAGPLPPQPATAGAAPASSAPSAPPRPRAPWEHEPAAVAGWPGGGGGGGGGSGAPRTAERDPSAVRREWMEQRQAERAEREGRGSAGGAGGASGSPPRRNSMEAFAARPVEERIVVLRRNMVASGATTGFLFAINMMTSPFFPWFIFPAVGMGVGLVKQWGTLWADGVGWKQILRPGRAPAGGGSGALPAGAHRPGARGGAAALPLASRAEAEAARLAPRDVLEGAHGPVVRRAVEDRLAIAGILATLSKDDLALLPEMEPTVDALVERAASLAQVLQRLDTDVSPEMVARIDARIASVEREPEDSADRERRLELLRRQQRTMRDLADRRQTVLVQMESASTMLGSLRLDLVRLRSSGVESAVHDVANATREARALSKEIGHVLDAASELRTL